MKEGTKLTLTREWIVGEEIGAGGFGRVYAVRSDGDEAVAKLVPKNPGAERETLFVDLDGVRNVIPIVDSGETADEWVLVMPRATRSLRQYLDAREDGRLDVQEAVSILADIADALSDLYGRVVHRDLKPENVLLWNGSWCLADFGISRYAEATTAPDTRKFALSPSYAAPERWRAERATSATDVYSLGIVAYELLTGSRPFLGPRMEEYREQHLHTDPPPLTGTPPLLAALVEECLYKAPGARLSPPNLARRLVGAASQPQAEGIARLQEANRKEVFRRAEAARRESESVSAEEVRRNLAESADKALIRIRDALRHSIVAAAPSVQLEPTGSGGWSVTLTRATLSLSPLALAAHNPWRWEAPAFDVVCHAVLDLKISADRYQYEGRSHALWFCDAQAAGEYAWYEIAFMVSPLIPARGAQDPFALAPGEKAAQALLPGLAEYQVAWPFTRLSPGALDEFTDRWAGWFADAVDGRLKHPTTMPERQGGGTWRTR